MTRPYSRGAAALMAAPLYAGPVLAGWAETPWGVAAVLAMLFFLARIMAGSLAGRKEMRLTLALLALALTQILVVLALYAAGLGLAWIGGALPLPLWLPLALTGLGAALLILRHPIDAGQDETIDLLDEALETIEPSFPFDADDDQRPDPEVAEATARAVAALWALPAKAPETRLDEIVQTLEDQTGPRAFPLLLAAIGEGDPAVDRAMIRYLLRPPIRHRLVADGADLPFAFELLLQSSDPEVQAELPELIGTLLDEGAPASALPTPEALRRQADAQPALIPLIARVAQAQEAAAEPEA
ncbi:hypothetical protein [Pseudodonghicola sp.]|uniref:hypothetical protein n=1 Tax=Pseudodonghicola sp. TaxID=1969463 RepID=UPI003A96E7EB